MIYKFIGLSESGTRVGETHHRAKLTDHDIDLIRELHEEGLSYKVIAEKFDIGKSTVADIVKCRRRWQLPVKWRRAVEAEPDLSAVDEWVGKSESKPLSMHGHCWHVPVEHAPDAKVHNTYADSEPISEKALVKLLAVIPRGRDLFVERIAESLGINRKNTWMLIQRAVACGYVNQTTRVVYQRKMYCITEKGSQYLLTSTFSTCLTTRSNNNEELT